MKNGITPFNITIYLLILNIALNAQDIQNYDKPVPGTLQNKISIDLDETPLEEALAEIMKLGGLYLNYNESIMPLDKKVSLKLKNVPALDVLRKILEQTDIDFKITKGGQVVLVKSKTAKLPDKYTISGFISDSETGEALAGTNVYIKELMTGCTSNMYGFYSLTLPTGQYSIHYSYMGYEYKEIKINFTQNIRQNIELKPTVISGETLFVTAESVDSNIKSTEIGTINLKPKELSHIPILFGEQDILKTMHLLPGVTQAREGNAGFFVRGGGSDQNLVLLDEAPVYNAFHFMGFFSVFNSDALKEVKLIKGCAPAKYGGKLSSVLDIQMNEGNSKNFCGNGGIGLIFSRLTLEGPILKNNGSYIISGRRSYADIFRGLSSNEDVQKSQLYFYDFNLKTNYRMSHRDRLFLSGYFGRDVLGFDKLFRISWGNQTATLRWNHLFNDKLFSNTSLIFSNFNYFTKIEPDAEDENYNEDNGLEVNIDNFIRDFTVKEDFQYFVNGQNRLNFGLHYIFHKFLPGNVVTRGEANVNATVGKRSAHEGALYLSHEFDATNRLKIDYGLRYVIFAVKGRADRYELLDDDTMLDIEFHEKENVMYKGGEPRLTANYLLNEVSSVKFGYARNYQHIHLLSNSTSGTPLDVWQPCSRKIKPQRAEQVSLGYFRNFNDNSYELSVETFYKDMRNQIDFKDGADVVFSTFFETDIAIGKGRAYGIEFLLKKKYGRMTGWLSYSLSKSERKFPDINSGKPFPAKYDRTHDFSIVGTYKISQYWSFSANWLYYTGNAITIPLGKYMISGYTLDAYSDRNAYRMPDYHRLDISFTFQTKSGNSLNISLYNAYGRKNAYTIFFRKNEFDPEKLSLFSYVPSISYNFNF